MNKKEQKNTYQAPQLKVVSFRVEMGVLGSAGSGGSPVNALDPINFNNQVGESSKSRWATSTQNTDGWFN